MATQFQKIPEKDVAGGIDQRSAPNNLQPSFSENLENFDTNSSGVLEKRKGYQGYMGRVPLRVQRVVREGADVKLVFDDSVQLYGLVGSPLVIFGKLSPELSGTTSTAITTTDGGTYVTDFTSAGQFTLSTGSGTLTIYQEGHGKSSHNLMVAVLKNSTTQTEVVFPDTIRIDETTYDIEIDYTVAADTDVRIVVAEYDESVNPGEEYNSEINNTTDWAGSGPYTHTIANATHGLDCAQLIPQLYQDTGSEREQYIPDDITINTSGDIVITSSTKVAGNFVATLGDDYKEEAVSAGTTTIEIDSPGGTLHMVSVFSISSGTQTQVIPDSIIYDKTNDKLQVTVTTAAALTLRVYHKSVSPLSNFITITDSTGTNSTFTFSDGDVSAANDTITEASHGLTAGQPIKFATTGTLPTGLTAGTTYLVAGVDTNTFTVTDTDGSLIDITAAAGGGTHTAIVEAYTDLAPQMTVWGIAHTGHYTSSSTYGGHVTHLDVYRADATQEVVCGLGGNFFVGRARDDADSAYLIPSTGVNITANVPAATTVSQLLASNSVTAASWTTGTSVEYTLPSNGLGASAIGHTLTISGMPRAVHNGGFIITAVSGDTITATNSGVNSADYDVSGATGTATIGTGKLTITSHPFAVGDILTGCALSGSTVTNVSGNDFWFDGITTDVDFFGGDNIHATRTSNTIPVDSTTNFVVGDMCSLGSYAREVRINSIDTAASTVTIDESLAFTDDQTLSVAGRWLPIEAPSTEDNIVHHKDAQDFDEQLIEKSVSLGDVLYLTNENDEVAKYDGSSIYRAGLLRFPALVFMRKTTQNGNIQPSDITATVSGATPASVLTVGDATSGISDTVGFATGDRVVDSADALFTVVERSDTVLKLSGTPAAGTLRKVRRLRYYYRAEMVDAQENRISGPAIGANDYIIEVGNDAIQVQFSFLKYPVDVVTDRSRIKYIVYRATEYPGGTFKEVASVEYNSSDLFPYVYTSDNSDVEKGSFDPVADAYSDDYVTGTAVELPTAVDQPQRAKFVTASQNKLLLANIKTYPQCSLTLNGVPEFATTDNPKLKITGLAEFRFSNYTASITNAPTYNSTGSMTVNAGADTLSFAAGTINADTMFQNGDRVYVDSFTGANLTVGNVYYVVNASSTTIQLSETSGGPVVDLDAGDAVLINQDSILIAGAEGTGTSAREWLYFTHSTASTGESMQMAGWWPAIQTSQSGYHRIEFYNGLTDALETGNPDLYKACDLFGNQELDINAGTDTNYGWYGGNSPVDENNPSYENLWAQRTAGAINCVSTALTYLSGAVNPAIAKTDSGGSDLLIGDYNKKVYAEASSDIGLGTIVITQMHDTSDQYTVTLAPSDDEDYDTLTTDKAVVSVSFGGAINDMFATTSPERVTLSESFGNEVFYLLPEVKKYPSRIIESVTGHAEVFDGPTTTFAEDFDSVYEVNTKDGQEITGILPFFGETTFSGAQKESVLVVFKEHSIYLLDLNTRGITKVQTEGVGCVAGGSLAHTRNGIIFAHDSGIYRLNRDLSIDYIGAAIERIWQDSVNRNDLSRATATHFAQQKQYKLGVPLGSASSNSKVLVYDHERERDRRFTDGAWTTYTNHNVTGWTNLGKDAFFGTTDGQVFKIRQNGEVQDYRDDASAVGGSDGATITYRAMDFGAPGIRKIVASIVAHLHTRFSDISNAALWTSIDTNSTFESAGTLTITKGDKKVESVKLSLPKRKCEYIQVKIVSTTKDEDLVLAGLDFNVGMSSDKGITQTASHT